MKTELTRYERAVLFALRRFSRRSRLAGVVAKWIKNVMEDNELLLDRLAARDREIARMKKEALAARNAANLTIEALRWDLESERGAASILADHLARRGRRIAKLRARLDAIEPKAAPAAEAPADAS